MANPEHLAILKQGVAVWNEWRKQNPHIRPDFSGADFASANFSKADFKQANFDRAELPKAELIRANLGGAQLTVANLTNAILRHTNLTAADLTGANLTEAILREVDLVEAELHSANLVRTTLSGPDLSRSNLYGAKLGGTKFGRARLTGTNFESAWLQQTVFADSDLSTAMNLGKVFHAGPSTIGLDSFFRSKGRIPAEFLRGAGVPDVFLEYAASFAGQPLDFYSCFISYSHEDKAFARLLHDRLQGQGIRCWLDEHQLLPGDDLHEGVDRGIRLWDKVLLCFSKSLLTSWWVDGEINRAFQKEAQIMKGRGKNVLALIPLNLDGFLFSADYQTGKKAEITSRVAANFVGWEQDQALFDRELEKVIRGLRTDEGGREKPPPTKL